MVNLALDDPVAGFQLMGWVRDERVKYSSPCNELNLIQSQM